MAVSAGVAYVDIRPQVDGFERQLEQATKPALERVSARMTSVGKGLTKAVTLPILGFGAAGIKAAADVDKGLREVNTLFGVSGKAAQESFAELQKGVQQLSRDVGVAQDQLVGGLYQAISAGVPKENAFTFMEVASKAAIAGVTDTETAIDGITTIINAFGLEASDAQRVADSMFTTVKGGKTDFTQLSSALFNVAPAAAAVGVGMEEVNAAIATLTAQGTPTSVVTTQLRATMVELTQGAGKASKAFVEIAGKSFPQFIAEGGTLQEALGLLADHADETGASVLDLFGSVEGGQAALALTGKGAEKFSSELENQAGAAGAAQTAFEEMENSSTRKFERLKTSFSNLAIEAGNALLPVVEKVTAVFSDLTAWFNRLDPGTRRLVGGFALVAAAIGPVLIITAKLITAFRTVFVAVKAVFTLVAANPWVLLIAATVALVVLIVKNWDTIKEALAAVWEWIKDAAGAVADFLVGIWEAIAGATTAAWDAVVGAVTGAWEAVVGAITGAVETVLRFLTETVPKIAGQLAAWVAEFVVFAVTLPIKLYAKLLGVYAKLGQWFLEGVRFIGEQLVKWGAVFLGWAGDLGKSVLENLERGFRRVLGFVTDMPGKLAKAGAGLWDFFYDGFKAAYNAVARFIRGLDFTINVPDFLPGPDEYTIGFPDLPLLGAGGRARAGRPHIVGELGPELFIPDRSGMVLPNEALSGASSTSIALTVNGARMSAADVADELGWLMKVSGR